LAFDCHTTVDALEIGDEHIWEAGLTFRDLWCWGVPLLRGGCDGGRSAVHVEFTVANLVDPRPGDRILPWGNTSRNGVLEDGSP
jgi:hypothetical protein